MKSPQRSLLSHIVELTNSIFVFVYGLPVLIMAMRSHLWLAPGSTDFYVTLFFIIAASYQTCDMITLCMQHNSFQKMDKMDKILILSRLSTTVNMLNTVRTQSDGTLLLVGYLIHEISNVPQLLQSLYLFFAYTLSSCTRMFSSSSSSSSGLPSSSATTDSCSSPTSLSAPEDDDGDPYSSNGEKSTRFLMQHKMSQKYRDLSSPFNSSDGSSSSSHTRAASSSASRLLYVLSSLFKLFTERRKLPQSLSDMDELGYKLSVLSHHASIGYYFTADEKAPADGGGTDSDRDNAPPTPMMVSPSFSSSLSSSVSSFSSAIAGVGGGRNHSNKLDINISTAKASFGGGGYGGPPRNNNSSSGDGVEPAMSSMGLSALLRKRSGSFEYGIAQGGSSSIEMLNFVAFVCSRFLYLQYTAHLVLPYANSMMTTTGALMYILVSFLGWVASWGAKRTNYLAIFRYYGHNSY